MILTFNFMYVPSECFNIFYIQRFATLAQFTSVLETRGCQNRCQDENLTACTLYT